MPVVKRRVCVCVCVCSCVTVHTFHMTAHLAFKCLFGGQHLQPFPISAAHSDPPPRSFTFSLAQFFVLSLFFFMLTRSPIRNAWLTNLSGSVFCVGSHQQTAVDGLSLSCFKLYCLTLQAELIPQVSSQICSSVIFSKNPRCQTEKKPWKRQHRS